jgi:tRNA pseudouridine55 synthase
MLGNGLTVRGGILVVRKPIGSTSFACVARVRRAVGVQRVGHCGTLDPFAEGVLPIVLGRATGLVRYMEGYDKEYRVTVRFGIETDTQDRTGTRTGGREPSPAELAEWRADGDSRLRTLVAGLVGERMQTPPMYSAVKVGGRPLYDLARQGIEIERTARRIRIHSAVIESVSGEDGVLRAVLLLRCTKGTYIRTLCVDLGRESGFGAHAEELSRTECGPFRIETAHTLEEIEEICHVRGEEAMTNLASADWLLPLEAAIADLPVLTLDDVSALRIVNGREVPAVIIDSDGKIPETVAVLREGLGLMAVCRLDDSDAETPVYRAERVFTDAAEWGIAHG